MPKPRLIESLLSTLQSSIALKLGGALGWLMFGALVIVGASDYTANALAVHSESLRWGKTTATLLAEVVEACVAENSLDVSACVGLQNLVEELTRESWVTDVVIVGRAGNVLANSKRSAGLIPVTSQPFVPSDAPAQLSIVTDPAWQRIDFAQPVRADAAGDDASSRVVARVYFSLNLATQMQNWTAKLWTQTLLTSGVALLCLFLFLGLLNAYVLRPVQVLGKQATKLGAGDLAARNALTRAGATGDEIARLAHALDRMAAQLEQGDHARQLAVAAEREQHVLAESLRDIAAAINSTLDLDQVLDLILTNVGRVVPHDAANIMLLAYDDTIHITRGRGYEPYGGFGDVRDLRFDALATLRTMIQSNQPVAIADVRADRNWIAQLPAGEWIRSYAGAPLRMHGRAIGFLNLDSATPGFYTPAHAERLQAFADQIAIAIENARLYTQVQELAVVDDLTGVYNRRGLFRVGEQETTRAVRYNRPLTAIMLDLDHFKQVNDTYGHMVGDHALRAFARCCRAAIRAMDLIGRYGGEEFVVVLPETDLDAAQHVAERLRQAIEKMTIPLGYPEPARVIQITASLGVAKLCFDSPNFAALIESADHAQYLAKQAGRNCVVINR